MIRAMWKDVRIVVACFPFFSLCNGSVEWIQNPTGKSVDLSDPQSGPWGGRHPHVGLTSPSAIKLRMRLSLRIQPITCFTVTSLSGHAWHG